MIARLTISLPRRLVARLDDEVRQGRRPSRSAAVAAALDVYYARRIEDSVREATVAYYRGLSEDEMDEDEAIARASRVAASAILARDEQGSARRRARGRKR